MPEKKTVQRARKAAREGKAPSTQAGEFVREEIKHVRQGKHGARSAKQAIAIGLSKARRAGVPLAPPKKGQTPEATRQRAERDLEKGQSGRKQAPSKKQSQARREVLKREPRQTVSKQALSKQAKQAAAKRKSASAASRKAAPAAKKRAATNKPKARGASG